MGLRQVRHALPHPVGESIRGGVLSLVAQRRHRVIALLQASRQAADLPHRTPQLLRRFLLAHTPSPTNLITCIRSSTINRLNRMLSSSRFPP